MNVLLGHVSCGGSVVLDMSYSAKIISPAYSLTMEGISSLVLDIDIQHVNPAAPRFVCQKCQEAIIDIASCIKATCLVCGRDHIVSSLYFTDDVPCICKDCLSTIDKKISGKQGSITPDLYDRFIEAFGLERGLRRVTLLSVLNGPIKI